ncbi:unnamed protein product [Closterium sp. NIES-65]|nr:unnamed protein product [Closterium sp. NIES-65]
MGHRRLRAIAAATEAEHLQKASEDNLGSGEKRVNNGVGEKGTGMVPPPRGSGCMWGGGVEGGAEGEETTPIGGCGEVGEDVERKKSWGMHGVIGDAEDGELGTSEGLGDNGMADDGAGDEEREVEDNEGSEEGGDEKEESENQSEEDGDNSEEEMYAPTDEERARMRTERPDLKRRCRKCSKWISFAGGTNSTGEGHMISKHKAHWDIWDRKWKAGEIGPNDYFPEGGYGTGEVPDGRNPWIGSLTWPAPPPTHGAALGQQPMTAYFGERFDKNALQQALIEFVVGTDQPFSVVEHPTVRQCHCIELYLPANANATLHYQHTYQGFFTFPHHMQFLQLMVTANPQCGEERVILTRATLARQLMRLAKLAQERLKAELHAEGVGTVAMTHDIWTGADHRAYMAVTGHCLTADFELRQVTLDFRVLPAEHTAEKIVEVLEDVVRDWELEGRTIAVTTDNASSNVAAMEYLCRGGAGDRQPRMFSSGLHVRCLAHICNLAVQLALKKVTRIAKPLALLRELASFIGYSPKRTGAFEGIQREENQRELTRALLRLRMDSENRWGSTYLMIEHAIRLRHAIETFVQRAPHCNAKDAARLQGLQIMELANFLQPFHAVTLAAEGSTYPTINRVVPQFNELLDELERMRDSTTNPPSQVVLGCIEAALGKLADY